MANLFKKLSNFEATIEIAGHDVEALFDADGLKLKVDADLAMAVLTHLGKLRGAKAQPRQRSSRASRPLPAPVASPELPQSSAPVPQPPPPRSERKAKEPPLPTPDELKAKREAKERERAKHDPEASAVSENPPSVPENAGKEKLPDAAEVVESRQAGQFVEDLETHKAADAAKLVAEGKATTPAELLEARNLRTVVAWMMDHYRLGTAAEVREACKAWQPHVPKLRDLPDASFKARIDNQFELESHDRAKGTPGAA